MTGASVPRSSPGLSAYLLFHGAQPKPPAKSVGQVDHQGIYPLRLAGVGHAGDDGQLTRHDLHPPEALAYPLMAAVLLYVPAVSVVLHHHCWNGRGHAC